ncbi:MAG: hypothetical protein DRO08_04150, partial [Thermoprotei archaeon]
MIDYGAVRVQATASDDPITQVPSSADPITHDKLRFDGAVEVGSRALGVEKSSSDYDFAMLRTNFDNLVAGNNYINATAGDVSKYFNVVPAYSSCSLVVAYITGKTDILLLEKQSHVDIIRKSISDMRKLPKYLYQAKSRRIALYQAILLRNGFVHSDYKQRIKYLPLRLFYFLKDSLLNLKG